jgi:hypothetical protein
MVDRHALADQSARTGAVGRGPVIAGAPRWIGCSAARIRCELGAARSSRPFIEVNQYSAINLGRRRLPRLRSSLLYSIPTAPGRARWFTRGTVAPERRPRRLLDALTGLCGFTPSAVGHRRRPRTDAAGPVPMGWRGPGGSSAERRRNPFRHGQIFAPRSNIYIRVGDAAFAAPYPAPIAQCGCLMTRSDADFWLLGPVQMNLLGLAQTTLGLSANEPRRVGAASVAAATLAAPVRNSIRDARSRG